MNAKPDTNIKPTTAEISKRIDDERHRLNSELALQSRLSAQRIAALDTSNNEALELIEGNLTGCLDRQSRIEERIAILEQRLEESQAHDEHDRLDEIAAAAERSRADAEKLIKSDYVKAARTLAAILAKLHASDTFIEQSNRELAKAGRSEVLSANAVRMRSRAWFEWSERKLVTAGDPNHPQHDDAERVQSGNVVAWKSKLTHQLIEPVEVEITHNDRVFAEYVEPLWSSITLPTVEPQGDPYVHANGHQLMDGTHPQPIWKAKEQ